MILNAQSDQHLALAQALGSAAKVLAGVTSTRAAPHGNNRAWFPNEGTIILGAGENPKNSKTLAEWQLRFDPRVEDDVEAAFLVVACERTQGGLHTQRFGALATVSVNGHVRDIIGLKDIPAGHTDYFHRPPLPRLPEFWPVSGCGTVYAWPIHKEHLQASGNQTVTIEVEEDVGWDIDYVVLCCKVPVNLSEGSGDKTDSKQEPKKPAEFYIDTLPKGKEPGDQPLSEVDVKAIRDMGMFDLVIDEANWKLWSREKDGSVNFRRMSIEQRYMLWYALRYPGTLIQKTEFLKQRRPSNVFITEDNISQVLNRLKKNLGGDLRDNMIKVERKGQMFFADEDWSYYWIRLHQDPIKSLLRWDFQGTE